MACVFDHVDSLRVRVGVNYLAIVRVVVTLLCRDIHSISNAGSEQASPEERAVEAHLGTG